MFELFTQGPKATHALNGGLGIGLALVRTIVELHGGTVEGASDGPGPRQPLHAATAGRRWPTRRRPAMAALPPPAAPARQPAVRAASWWPTTTTTPPGRWRSCWSWPGTARVRAAGGERGAARWREQTGPMSRCSTSACPTWTAYEVARRLRAAPATRDIVLVALTGWGSASDRARALEAGFDALLSKPADLQALLGAIERATTARRLPTGE